MRLAILALLYVAGTAALCQSSVPAPAKPEDQWLILPQPAPEISMTTRSFKMSIPPRPAIAPPIELKSIGPGTVDPEMVVHPPQSSFGEQPPATDVAQNLYPGLTLSPIDEWKGNGNQIPITWPNLKVQNIPTSWSKLEIKPVENVAATKPAWK
jgi:hypothetical protein